MTCITDVEEMHKYYNKRWYNFTGTDFEFSKNEGWNQMFRSDDQERAWERWRHF